MSNVDFVALENEFDILLNVLFWLVAWLPVPYVYTDESLEPELLVYTDWSLDPELEDVLLVATVPFEEFDCADYEGYEGYELTLLPEAAVLAEANEWTDLALDMD